MQQNSGVSLIEYNEQYDKFEEIPMPFEFKNGLDLDEISKTQNSYDETPKIYRNWYSPV